MAVVYICIIILYFIISVMVLMTSDPKCGEFQEHLVINHPTKNFPVIELKGSSPLPQHSPVGP